MPFASILTALGWSLLDSIWQLAAVWTAYHFLTAGNKRISAAGKHNLAFMFITMGSGWIVVSFIHLLNNPFTPVVSGFIPGTLSVNHWIPYLTLVYLFILILRSSQYGFQCYARNKNKSGKLISPLIQSFTEKHARLIGISRSVRVYLSDVAESAVTGGIFRPWILLPISLVTRLTSQQLESILIHELFHIRRNDYLINIMISCFRSILFFNPFAHLFYRAIARERELACDDGVLEREYSPALYAEALYSLEKFRQPQPDLLIAADGNRPWLLMERILRVLGKPDIKKNRFSPLFIIGLAAAFALFGVQLKTSPTVPMVRITATPAGTLPLHNDFVTEKINVTVNGIAVSRSAHLKTYKRRTLKKWVLPVVQELESAGEPDASNQAFFAADNIVKNYSNQEASGESMNTVQLPPGTPYLPSMSLSYEAIPGVRAADSLQQEALLSGMIDMVTTSRINDIVNLNKAAVEMDKNRKELKEIELQNRQLILLDQKNTRPLLEKIHREIKLKKRDLDRMRIQLQHSEEEIIHI